MQLLEMIMEKKWNATRKGPKQRFGPTTLCCIKGLARYVCEPWKEIRAGNANAEHGRIYIARERDTRTNTCQV